MKNILLVIACLSIPASGMTATLEENLSLMQEYLDKNQLEKVEDIYDENEETLGQSWLALERLAISLERRQKHKQAIEIYRKIINNFNKADHEGVLRAKPNAVSPALYENNRLPFYYYKLAFNNAQIFFATNEYTPVKEKITLKKNTEGFIALARKVKVDESELKMLEQILKGKIVEDYGKLFKQSWYASVDLMSWQDRVYIINNTTGAKNNLIATTLGTCIGAGKKWENVRYQISLEGCYASGKATISAEQRSVSYQQSAVAVSGVVLSPGIYFKSLSEAVLVGVALPIKYRTGDWTNPDPTLYSFERESSLEAGIFLQSKIKFNKLSLRTRFGKVFPNPGVLWTVGLLYDF